MDKVQVDIQLLIWIAASDAANIVNNIFSNNLAAPVIIISSDSKLNLNFFLVPDINRLFFLPHNAQNRYATLFLSSIRATLSK